MSNKQKMIDLIISTLEEMVPGSEWCKMYRKQLEDLSEKAFKEWVGKLKSGQEFVRLQIANGSPVTVDVDRNIAVAKKLGIKLYQHCWLTDPQTGMVVKTRHPALIGPIPVRRQIQLLTHKVSIPANQLHLDQRTNQPTGESKGSRLSSPEGYILAAQNKPKLLKEFLNYRGGNLKAFNALNQLAAKHGEVTQADLDAVGGRPKAIETTGAYLNAMMLGHNL